MLQFQLANATPLGTGAMSSKASAPAHACAHSRLSGGDAQSSSDAERKWGCIAPLVWGFSKGLAECQRALFIITTVGSTKLKAESRAFDGLQRKALFVLIL